MLKLGLLTPELTPLPSASLTAATAALLALLMAAAFLAALLRLRFIS